MNLSKLSLFLTLQTSSYISSTLLLPLLFIEVTNTSLFVATLIISTKCSFDGSIYTFIFVINLSITLSFHSALIILSPFASIILQSFLCIVTPLPLVIYPTISSPKTGLQQFAKLVKISPYPAINILPFGVSFTTTSFSSNFSIVSSFLGLTISLSLLTTTIGVYFKLDIPKHTSSKLSHDNSSHNLVIFSSVNTSFIFICFFFFIMIVRLSFRSKQISYTNHQK